MARLTIREDLAHYLHKDSVAATAAGSESPRERALGFVQIWIAVDRAVEACLAPLDGYETWVFCEERKKKNLRTGGGLPHRRLSVLVTTAPNREKPAG